MERYESYKDSGIEWIGEIPEHWQVCRISCLFSEEKRINSNLDNYHALKFMDGTIVPKPEKWLKEDIEETYSKYRVVSPGTIMINNLNLNFDLKSKRVGIVLENGIITSAYLALVPDFNSVIPSFYNYVFKGWDSRKAFHGMGSGLRKTLNWEELSKHKVVHPLIKEQRVIAEYLDRKTFEIDSLVQKTEKFIALLQEYRKSVISEAVTKGLDLNVPMKDSGIEWIGEIPEGWSISSLKYLASIKGGSTPSKSNPAFWGGEIPWVSSQEVKLSRLTDTSQHITQEALDYCSNVVFPAETVVMVVRSGILKHTLPVSILDKPMTINQDIKAVQFFRDSQSAFFYYFVKGLNNALLHELCKDGSTVDNLDIDLLSRCPIIQPPIDEQTAIVDYLDQKTSEIDSLIEKKKQLVEKLQEYRKSLISECVTGKVKVPGVE